VERPEPTERTEPQVPQDLEEHKEDQEPWDNLDKVVMEEITEQMELQV